MSGLSKTSFLAFTFDGVWSQTLSMHVYMNFFKNDRKTEVGLNVRVESNVKASLGLKKGPGFEKNLEFGEGLSIRCLVRGLSQ